jgi:hypothetical protein
MNENHKMTSTPKGAHILLNNDFVKHSHQSFRSEVDERIQLQRL